MLPRFSGEMRVGSDVTYTFSASGMAIAKFSAVADKSKKNDAGEWEKTDEIWVRVTCFKTLADNVAESVQKGSLVLVNGQVSVSKYQTKDGQDRQSVEVIADDIGLSLRFKPAHHAENAVRKDTAKDDNPWADNPVNVQSGNVQTTDAGPPF